MWHTDVASVCIYEYAVPSDTVKVDRFNHGRRIHDNSAMEMQYAPEFGR